MLHVISSELAFPPGSVSDPPTTVAPQVSGDHPALPFEQAAALVLGALQHALQDLFAASPKEIRRAVDLERVYGVNHLLGCQIYRVASASNPLAAGMHVPPRVSLKKLLAAAARRRVPAATIDGVLNAFEAFESLVAAEGGDREELLAMLSALLPEERGKQELANRRAAFKAMSQLKGLTSEAVYVAMLYHPASDAPGMFDVRCISGGFGVRRVRSDARIVLGAGTFDQPETERRTLDGRVVSDPFATILPQFSSTPLPRMESRRSGSTVYYWVADRDVGMRSAVDVVSGDLRRGTLPAQWKPGLGLPCSGPSFTVDAPVKRMTCDMFLHRDFCTSSTPEVVAYDIACSGFVRKYNDPDREHDRVNISETVRPMPSGLTAARVPNVPRHEMLEYLYGSQSWDPNLFRGFRLDVQYPVYGTQYWVGFKVPDVRG